MAKQQNYLDFIPGKNPDYPVHEQEDGLVTVIIPHRGFYSKIAQIFFRAPAQSHIDLDRYGSFIWKRIDGQRSIFEIGTLVGTEFGKAADPLYPRLVQFFSILKEHRFIVWRRVG